MFTEDCAKRWYMPLEVITSTNNMEEKEIFSPAGARDEIRDLYNNAPCGLHSLDKDGVFVRVNDTELGWLGYTQEDLIGKTKITDLLAPIPRSLTHLKPKGSADHVEMQLVCKDGSILPVLVSEIDVQDSQNNYLMRRSIFVDRERMPSGMRLLDAAPDAIVVMNRDGRIALVNEQAEKIFGYGREELLGQEIEMLMPEHLKDRHAAHRADYCDHPKVRPMGAASEMYGLRKDGTEFPVEISLSPLRTGEEWLVLSAIRDITDRRRADEALRLSEERFRVALKNSSVVVFHQDHELRYTWINSPVLVWAEKDYLGHTDAEIVGGEEGARLTAIKRGVLQSGIGTRTETTITFLGETHHFDLTVEPLRNAFGVVIGVTCAAANVTALKQVAAEKERLIGELQEALARVKLLSGLLPICAGCKMIRDEHGAWQQMEMYIRAHSEANFSHGLCPDCSEQFGWTEQESGSAESREEQAAHAGRQS